MFAGYGVFGETSRLHSRHGSERHGLFIVSGETESLGGVISIEARFRRNRATVRDLVTVPQKTALFVLHLAFLHPFVLLHLLLPHLLKLSLLLGCEYSVDLVM